MAVCYSSFTFTNWFAPLVVAFLKPKFAMLIGGVFYAFFIAQFIYPNNILLYCASGLLGLGGSSLWVAQGNFLTINSNADTMERNSAFFFATFQSSMVWGNTFIYFLFQNIDDIDKNTRLTVQLKYMYIIL